MFDSFVGGALAGLVMLLCAVAAVVLMREGLRTDNYVALFLVAAAVIIGGAAGSVRGWRRRRDGRR